jgi:hypothetical protein
MRTNQARGSKHYCAKLTENDIRLMRCAKYLHAHNVLDKGKTDYIFMKELAAMYNVSYNAIYDIMKQRTWKHV